MRWVFVGLLLFGLGFAAIMLVLPGGGGDPPDWTRAMGRGLSGLAPRVTAFADGSTVIVLPASGGEAHAAIGEDADRGVRILTLRLIEGTGPVRAIHRCTPSPKGECSGEAEMLCLGARHPDCEQDEIGMTGSFAISPGGGQLRIVASGRARLRIEN